MSLNLTLIMGIGLSGWMALAWLIQRLTRISAWVDAMWSFGVGLGSVWAVAMVSPFSLRGVLIGTVIALWSLRLGGHLVQRALRGHDDPRYAALIEKWGKSAGFNLFVFLQIQALSACVLVLGVWQVALKSTPMPDHFDIIGVSLVAVALIGEAVADRQLAAFTHRHTGHKAVCDHGLWAWSRHPNYFFEWLLWVGVALLAVPTEPLFGPWLWAFAAPAMMYGLLVHVSGLPPLEAHMRQSRGKSFEAYARRTSAFFPWPPRRRA